MALLITIAFIKPVSLNSSPVWSNFTFINIFFKLSKFSKKGQALVFVAAPKQSEWQKN